MTYTIKTAADALGVSVAWVRALIWAGKLPATKDINERGVAAWYISQDAIDQYKEQSQ